MKLPRYRHDSPFSYTLGATLSYELFKTHPEQITRVFLRPNIEHGPDLKKIIEKFKQHNIDIIESNKAFNVLNANNKCLLIAEFTKTTTPLDDSPSSPHIVLVNPSNSGNLGTIMRSAAAFDFKNIAIITPAVDYFDPKTIRASMGAIFHLNIESFTSFDSYLKTHTSNKRKLYAFMLDSTAQTLSNTKPKDKNYALIFGNEASGLNPSFATIAKPVYIPQSKNTDSLNLSVATSIAIYHFSNL